MTDPAMRCAADVRVRPIVRGRVVIASAGTSGPSLRGLLMVLLALAALSAGSRGAESAVLDLQDDGVLPGTLVSVPADEDGDRETILWRSPSFETPFEFFLDEVMGMRFEPQEGGPPVAGECLIHLRGGDAPGGGDVLAGSIEAIEGDAVVAKLGGRLSRIDRSIVERITWENAAEAARFIGPGSQTGWQQSPPEAWRDEAGALVTSRRSATIARDVAAPPRARFDMVLSWRGKSEFRVSVAASPKGQPQDPYRVELLHTAGETAALALVRQEAGAGRLEPLPGIAARGQKLELSLFVDQEAGRLVAVVPADAGAKVLADVTVAPAGREPSGWFRLSAISGELRLERLVVTPWTSAEPILDPAPGSVVMADGRTLTEAMVESFDAASGILKLRRGDEPQEVPIGRLREIAFPEAGAAPVEPEGALPTNEPATVHVSGRDGQALTGRLVSIDDDYVWLRRLGIDEPIGMPRATLRTLEIRRTAESPRELPGRVGRLVAPGLSMRGCIVDSGAADSAAGAGVAWQPRGSRNASRLRRDADGGTPEAVVHYVEPKIAEPSSQEFVGGIGSQVQVSDDGVASVMGLLEGGAAAKDGRLRPGDRIEAVSPEKESPFVQAKGLGQETISNLLRGRVGSSIRLRVTSSDDEDSREIELVREAIGPTTSEALAEILAIHARLAPTKLVGNRTAATFPSRLFLLSGDVIWCRVETIGESGVGIVAPAEGDGGQAIVVPHATVKAIELVPIAVGRVIERSRAERLLTLPRSQRADPPRHLVRLVAGDYLRGTVESLDDARLGLKVQGEVKMLPRAEVARIIWLHPEQGAGEQDSQEAAPAPTLAPVKAAELVQGVAADGRRLTLVPTTVKGDLIHGRSPAIGDLVIDVRSIDRLLLGPAIKVDTKNAPYSQWKLRPAAEPRALREKEG